MSSALRDRYEKHHDVGKYGFTFGGAERVAFLRSALVGVRVLVDLGCRDGTLASRLHLPNVKIIGFDIDRVALRKASTRGGITPVQANLWAGLPLRSSSVDGILAGEFLEHCPDPWYTSREVLRVLDSGGVFAGTVPNAARLKNRLRFVLGRDIELDRTHLHSFSPGSLRRCLEEAGFVVQISFLESRLLRLGPRLFGNTIAFRAVKPALPA